MTRDDIVTRSKNGQWLNEVEGDPAASRSFSSREEAVEAGRVLAVERGSRHRVEDSEPTGSIVDGGAPEDDIAVVGEKEPDPRGLPDTTDDDGLPLESPSG